MDIIANKINYKLVLLNKSGGVIINTEIRTLLVSRTRKRERQTLEDMCKTYII